MSDICKELHQLVWQGKRFDFNSCYDAIPKNGIYILFEKGETAHGGDRIVRIGTHTGDNQLPSRIYQHFENENKNRSIFRKNIGRCLLNMENSPYLPVWNLDTTSKINKEKYGHLIDKEFEKSLEKRISQYLQDNFSFVIIESQTKQERLLLESRLIGTVSNCAECRPSANWLGLQSPVAKIRESGLWLVMGLYSQELQNDDFAIACRHIVQSND